MSAARNGADLVALDACLHEAAALPALDSAECARLATRLAERTFHLVVAGQFKRGKSSVVNALLGARVVPVGVVPLTAVVTIVQHGERASARVAYLDGREAEVPLADLPRYVTERDNPRNQRGVRLVTVACPAHRLRGGVRLVDTPGIGSVYEHNSDAALRYLPQADAIVVVTSAEQPIGGAELEFMRTIRAYAPRVLCILNKADQLSGPERDEVAGFARKVVADAFGLEVPVIPLSAREALLAAEQSDATRYAASGMAGLDVELERLLVRDRELVFCSSLARSLLRLLDEGRLAVELESRALAAPLAEVEARLALVAQRRDALVQQRRDDAVLLADDLRRLRAERFEPELEAFALELQGRVGTSLDRHYAQAARTSLPELARGLEEHAVGTITAEYDRWRAERDAAFGRAVEQVAGRYRCHVEQAVDELLRYSAELFAADYRPVAGDAPLRTDSAFYYQFAPETASLRVLTGSALTLLPHALGGPLILRRAKRRALELVDRQAGRLRYDFSERLESSARTLRDEIDAAMQRTLAGMEEAVQRGLVLHRRGATECQARQAELAAQLRTIDALREQVREITACTASSTA